MSEAFETIKGLIEKCSDDERKELSAELLGSLSHSLESEWGIDAATILSAIHRSSDLTKRGVRGIIAEAVFEKEAESILTGSGWRRVLISGNLSYDALVKKGDLSARIQIKLQRLEKGVPKLYYPKYYEGSHFVVEVQKTRSGEQRPKTIVAGTETVIPAAKVKTRPYRFGDFDILAVNMHPSSGDWKSFRYTLGNWLLPRPQDEALIEIFQPISVNTNDVWTDDLVTCLKWLENGESRRILEDLLHRPNTK